MAKTQDQLLDEAITHFRMGKSVRECEKITGVNYKKIEREAKKRSHEKGELSQLTSSMAKDRAEFVTLSVTEQNIVTKEVDAKSRIKLAIEGVVEEAVTKASELLRVSDSGSDFNQIMSGLDKASITAGINERHAKPTQILNNQQNNYAGMSLSDVEREIKQIEQRQTVN